MTIQAIVQQQSTTTSLLETMSATLSAVTDMRSNATTQNVQLSNTNQSELRLPPIEIPDFDGNLSNWIRFRDLYVSMVDSRTNISNVQKLEYLQMKLKGEASTVIKHLTPTNDNYNVAWELLKENYDNSEMIVEKYLELLFDQKHVKNATASDFKKFYHNTVEAYNALKTLKGSLDSWDYVLMFHMKKKLDTETITLWRRQRKEGEIQTFPQLLKFLRNRVVEVEEEQKANASIKYQRQSKIANVATANQSCPICNDDHFLYNCSQFKALDVDKRKEVIFKNKLCFNCLKGKHISRECKSGPCKVCGLKHNTLLHMGDNVLVAEIGQQSDSDENPTTININVNQQVNHETTLLPTAIVMVRDKNKSLQPCRALIDSGAQSTLVSEACVQRLQLPKSHDNTVLYGVGGEKPNYTKGKVQLEIFAEKHNRTLLVKTYCLQNLTQYLPTHTVKSKSLDYFRNLPLADPAFHQRSRIDIILGANVFPHCILDGQHTHPSGSPIAVNTIFGWIVMGDIIEQPVRSTFVAHVYPSLDIQLQKFWETEECTLQGKIVSPDEEKAEKHYMDTVQRLHDGRYMVRLPFKNDSIELGESKLAAMKRLQSMERRFMKNEDLKVEFLKFMDEYKELNHMETTPSDIKAAYYMPHHAVLKPTSTTTKLRVVFDASCKSSNDLSLNDHLLVGPTIQNDLFTILLKFRKFEIGFSADVEKMYRQVLIHPEDRPYQCILWRKSPLEEPETYQLRTITYGTVAAPFLATRTLKQVAIDNSTTHPDVSYEIDNNFYVDDYMSCAPDIETANSMRKNLCSVLSSAGFNLRKWASNSHEFQEPIGVKDRDLSSSAIINDSGTVKTLGLLWNTESDCFQYSICFQEHSDVITKRQVLSDISKVYDPIGWLSPVIITLKIFMQKLWLKGVSWDQDLPSPLKNEWLKLQNDMQHIKDLKIPRWFNFQMGDIIELHGFADSSQLAYAASIYIRIIKPNGTISTCLLSSKTRVTPIKQISLPRLELCAAHLMVKLMAKVKNAFGFHDVPTYGWTDSTVVLAWISDHPVRWKTFIANRTSYIIDKLPATQWRHISSQFNPADLATRGVSSSDIMDNRLWWQGPPILQNPTLPCQSTFEMVNDTDLERRKNISTAIVHNADEFNITDRYSNFNTLLRITALVLRFINNCKFKGDTSRRIRGFITTSELKAAQLSLVKLSQDKFFYNEKRILAAQGSISRTNKLAALTPFLDPQGILRVGGRLENARINYDQKHPLILHAKDPLASLIVRHYHLHHLHAGTRQLQYLLSLKYWIPDVIHLIKRTVYKCTTCMRFRQIPYQQRMGDLPSYRVQPCPTFERVGVDFAGPTLVKSWKGRGSKNYKCWIAVFVCLSTKAIHLEAVTELSAAAFMATLRRFVSRRGKPRHIYTDNGTNFVGCNQELKELFEFLSDNFENINQELSFQEIQWHFTPPSGPTFGGIWEAGVKSVKFHLKRVLKNSSATYEELSTLLCQIECCLNSRPLCLKFEGDEDPLTPGHFLILRPMVSIPDENLINVNVNRLTRWQYMQHLVQQFWSKWSKEYLCQLQRKPKWVQISKNLQIGDMVLIREDNLPPAQWLMGRILLTHPGNDGLVRVATIKTKNGSLKRPISKLCPLLLDS
ncbi:uncharacterized protein LOC119604046 [Lucilia sericata]|uniref:uncharacterized protein LOC119604046 n=1 Tax=Lucilia sericata TaxID=13632 RepID=UPI0018A85AA7|nr:uncharacterized protein LOC119604046 [Lucilia sericata]